MSYPADTPAWDTLVGYMEEHGFERKEEEDMQFWLLDRTAVNPDMLLDDNAEHPGNLALWREPIHDHEPKGQWVLLHEGDPANMLVRLMEELA